MIAAQNCFVNQIISMQQQIANQSIFTLKQFDQSNDSPRRESINLPDFEVSQVIGTNQLIDIRCEEERPFDNFFLRINEMGYQTNHITNQTIYLGQNSLAKYSNHQQNSHFQRLQQKGNRTTKRKKAKRQLLKRVQKVSQQLFQLDCEKVDLIDCIHRMKQDISSQFTKYQQAWNYMASIFEEQVQTLLKQQRVEWEEQNQRNLNRIEQLQRIKQHSNIQQHRNSQKMYEMEQEISKLNVHINHLQAENEEKGFQLLRLHQYEQKISNYQQQIENLNNNLEQNSQYIFDLEQKVANSNFQLSQKQNQVKKHYQESIQQLKQKIQKDYTLEFQRIHQEIKLRAIEQAYQQCQIFHTEMDQLKRQLQAQSQSLQNQKNYYQNKITILQREKIKLVQETRNYQAKLHQLQQTQMLKNRPKQEDKIKIQELAVKLKNIEDKYRDKQVQLNYYKSLKSKPQKIKQQSILDRTIIEKLPLKQRAISPSSGGIVHHKYKPRQELINNILSRIKLRQQGSNASQLLQNSMQSGDMKKTLPSTLRPISPQSMLLQKEKDVRMRNISSKLQQLRSDIRRQIGMMRN